MTYDEFLRAAELRTKVILLQQENYELLEARERMQERIENLESQPKQAEIIFKDTKDAIELLDALSYSFKNSVRSGKENCLVMGFNEISKNYYESSLWVELRLVDGNYKIIFRNK